MTSQIMLRAQVPPATSKYIDLVVGNAISVTNEVEAQVMTTNVMLNALQPIVHNLMADQTLINKRVNQNHAEMMVLNKALVVSVLLLQQQLRTVTLSVYESNGSQETAEIVDGTLSVIPMMLKAKSMIQAARTTLSKAKAYYSTKMETLQARADARAEMEAAELDEQNSTELIEIATTDSANAAADTFDASATAAQSVADAAEAAYVTATDEFANGIGTAADVEAASVEATAATESAVGVVSTGEIVATVVESIFAALLL